MNSLPIARQIRAGGFTLTELMVSLVLATAVSMMILSVLTTTMKLSTQNVVTNVSNYRARQTLDRVGSITRYAQDTPLLITSAGVTTTGSSDGILIKNALGGPYVFKNSNGQADAEIASTDKTFIVEFATVSGAETPKVGEYFSVSLSTQPQLEIASVGTVTTSGSVSKCPVTTVAAIGEAGKPGAYTVTAYRYRKEAYVFAQSGSYWSLRRYPKVTASMSYSVAANYSVLGTGYQKLGTSAFFTTTTDNGTQAAWLRALVRSSNRSEYAEKISNKTTLTTMPVQIKLWNYNAPPPTS